MSRLDSRRRLFLGGMGGLTFFSISLTYVGITLHRLNL